MKIVLTKRHPTLGQPGQIVEVADAFARNFLLPKGWATVATTERIAQTAANQQQRAKSAERQRQQWRAAAAQVQAAVIPMTAAASPTGKLFAALKTADLMSAAAAQGLTLSDAALEPDHWKTTGRHQVAAVWPDGSQAQFTLEVTDG